LFNWLGQDLGGLACLDLFAGSGALGFEAASRGAAHVRLLERDPRLAQGLRDTANRLGYTLYPIDVPGFEGDEGMDASLARPVTGGWNVRENEVHSALTYLAAQTGGLAMINLITAASIPAVDDRATV